MQNSQSYRENAAMCLLAAQEASDLNSRRLHLSMALSWLSLAREDQAVGDLIESWDAAKREAWTPMFQWSDGKFEKLELPQNAGREGSPIRAPPAAASATDRRGRFLSGARQSTAQQ